MMGGWPETRFFEEFRAVVQYRKYAHNGVGMPENVGESGRGLTILVVDDHDSVRLLLVKALRRRGFNVAEADSGVAALTLLASMEAKLNLALIDVVMPGMDGLTLAKRIDSLYPGSKILFMSGYSSATLEQEHRFTADLLPFFLRKPFGADILIAKVNELLDSQMTRGPL
jgi:two-component system cell cycle sensor histidine kinase/response regulator CckA